MGAGKSTVGKQLARVLGKEFVDTDQEIERRSGADISWIFDVEGEDGFRKREASVIDELTQKQGIVLATGGGAVADKDSRARLAARGTVVYLEASIEQQLDRTNRDRNRPLLSNSDDPREVLEALMAERDPMYREIADMIVPTTSRTVKSVANEIVESLRL